MINYTLENDIATIQLDDGKANVFSLEMIGQFSTALDDAEKNARATIITGREGQFSAGYDLSVMQSGDPKAMITMVIAGFELLCKVAAHAQPTIAACTGNAMGLGAFMLLAADTRIAIDQASKICLPETRAGMQFPPILVAAAKGRLNPSKYIEAALQSMVYTPRSAIEAGFIDEVVQTDQLGAAMNQATAQLMQLPKDAYGRNKRDLLADKLGAMHESLEQIKANPAVLAS